MHLFLSLTRNVDCCRVGSVHKVRFQGCGFELWGVLGLGFSVCRLGFRPKGLGFRPSGVWFKGVFCKDFDRSYSLGFKLLGFGGLRAYSV